MTTAPRAGPVKLGSDVTIQPGAVVTSAEIGDGSMIGMGASIGPGSKIGNDCYIDGGAVVAAGTHIPAGQLWTGSPARFLRSLSQEEMSYLRSTALVYEALSNVHFRQGAKSVEDVEKDHEESLQKREMGLAPEQELPATDEDVIEYYKLNTLNEDAGIFRKKEHDTEAEVALKEQAELDADAAENRRVENALKLERVGSGLKALAATRPESAAAREKLLNDLAAFDPQAAAMLKDLMARIGAAAAPGADSAAKTVLLNAIRKIEPSISFYMDDKDAAEAAEAVFARVAAHSQAMQQLPAAGAGGSAAAAGGAGAAQLR